MNYIHAWTLESEIQFFFPQEKLLENSKVIIQEFLLEDQVLSLRLILWMELSRDFAFIFMSLLQTIFPDTLISSCA